MGKTYDFNTADTLNTLLLNCIFASGQLKGSEMYDVDFDHQIIEIEKYDAKPTYKKFFGYRPGVSVIGDLIVGIENSNGNTNVRFHQKNTQKRFFERFEQNGLIINRFRTDCGACSKEIVEEIEKTASPSISVLTAAIRSTMTPLLSKAGKQRKSMALSLN